MTGYERDDDGDKLAIVGVACRFPGAQNSFQFWRNLRQGVESITYFDAEGRSVEALPPIRPFDVVRAAGVLEDADAFDASFFGYSPFEARILDPQHRVFLECAQEALDDAGCDPTRFRGAIGVYAGGGETSYLELLRSQRHRLAGAQDWQLGLATGLDFLTTRVAYKLGLRGPAVTVQTGCSTSLVAIHMAAQALLSGDCDAALAGGVTVHVPRRFGHYTEGGVLSPDGRCRPFDARARGTVGANGVGLVLLKRLADAIAGGDHIRAVFLGSAINNDASDKIGFTAPSVSGQSSVIRAAHRAAQVDSQSISYVEAHGTATPLGDPIEVAALGKAFGTATRRHRCWLGSVKSNIGHVDAAAGVAGLIKTVLALEHAELPPSLHFESANPELGLEQSPFSVNTELRPWPKSDHPRRAGVSSLGIGGTNAHVVLEEAPARLHQARQASRAELLLLSAKSQASVERAATNLAAHLMDHSEASLGDVAWTLQTGRQEYEHRRFVVCTDHATAVAGLRGSEGSAQRGAGIAAVARPVVFMFSGHGGQYVGMGRELYRVQRVFREAVDACSELAMARCGIDPRTVLFPDATDPAAVAKATAELASIESGQLANFIVEYALARQWMAWGVQPAMVVGHSLGAYVAAVVASVFSLEGAIELIVERGRLLSGLGEGAMLAVPLSEEEVRPMAGPDVSIAVVNGPGQCTLAGSVAAMQSVHAQLAAMGVESRILHIPRAGHSHLFEPLVPVFEERVRRIPRSPPSLPYMSDVNGDWLSGGEATDPRYWASHLRRTVRFGDALSLLLSRPASTLLEIGPGCTLTTLARRHPQLGEHLVVSSLPHASDETSDLAHALGALGRLWAAGARISWGEVHSAQARKKVPLPGYSFERKRYIVESEDSSVLQPVLPEVEVSRDPSDIERTVAHIFGDVLGLSSVGLHDNFFELGGDSLMATQLITRLHATFAVPLRVKTIFKTGTVHKIAQHIGAGE